ncbi:MAG: helix-turn-helix domain-containing protein [Turneriella sp.]
MQPFLLVANMALLSALALRLVPALKTRRGWFAMGLITSSMAYFVNWYLSDAEMHRALRSALLVFVVGQPVFFWLTANTLFDDQFRLRSWHYLLIAGKFILAAILSAGRPIPNIFRPVDPAELPRILPNFFYTLAFVFHAMATLLRTNRSDLVEPRRRLRTMVLFVTGLLIVQALISASVLRPLGFGAVSDGLSLLLIYAALLAGVAWGNADWDALFLVPARNSGEGDPQVMQKALAAMEKDELFRTEGLTVTALAEKLGLPEYKLRRAINGGLGYRNFNEYLNFYRIRAARKFLEDAKQRDYPLIHLALDLGYPSPAPFNRAFKEATGMAPGEYRRKFASLLDAGAQAGFSEQA